MTENVARRVVLDTGDDMKKARHEGAIVTYVSTHEIQRFCKPCDFFRPDGTPWAESSNCLVYDWNDQGRSVNNRRCESAARGGVDVIITEEGVQIK